MNGYETKARELLKTYRELKQGRSVIIRPIMIEWTGTPEAGKTSVVTTLTRFFKQMGWRTLNPLEGAEATKLISRRDPRYNLRTLTYILDQILEKSYADDFELIFLDRGIYDFYCWAQRWLNEGAWSEEICRINQRFAMQPKLTSLIDLAIFTVCQPDISLARNKMWALTQITGETTNIDSVAKLVKIWGKCFQELKDAARPVEMVDTSFMPPIQVGQKMLDLILKTIETKLQNHQSLELP